MTAQDDRSCRSSAYCYRCGHLWMPKTDDVPRRCPRCHSSRWGVPEKKARTCKFCGIEFQMEALDDPCPCCGKRQSEAASDIALHCNQCDYEWNRRATGLPKKCPLCHSSEWNLPKVERLMCQQCGHLWRNKRGHPSRCPKCQSRLWDKPLKAVRCQRCGHIWKMRDVRSSETAILCPSCKSIRWNEAPRITRSAPGSGKYSKTNSKDELELMVCRACSNKWYGRRGDPPICPRCGEEISIHDRMASTSMRIWTDGRMELTYVSENGFGYIYLWDDDVPVATCYAYEVLSRFDMTIGDVVRCVNEGSMRNEWRDLAEEMLRSQDDYERYIDYFMKRLSLDKKDARILAIHFTGMGPEAIAKKFSYSSEEVRESFDRIMAAYSDSGIIVDDTIFTDDPFRFY